MTDDDRVVAGRYRLGERLGSGAMGIVWQARDERLHRTVAIKQLLLQPGLSPAQAEEARQRCMREGRIAARLAHPNAVTVYDVAEHAGEPWLIMEYLPSKSLAAVLAERGTLPPEEAARIGAQIASALVAAHAAGIVHRDIKPANVLLGDDGTVKITDFGISRATGDVTVTATGMLAGTPAYLAPEVAKGKEPSSASDVFSLGSTLYTAVEGHSPFGLSENTLALLYAVAAGKVTPPRQAGPLTALLMRLLRAEPSERQSMAEARDALTAIAAGRPAPGLANQPPPEHTEVMRPQPVAQHRPPMPPPIGMPGPPHPATLAQNHPPAASTGHPNTPGHGHPATRLDLHPYEDPSRVAMTGVTGMPEPPTRPSTGRVHPGHPGPGGPGRPPSGNRPTAKPNRPAPAPGSRAGSTRKIVLTVLAIVAAALVGILVANLLTANEQPNSKARTKTTQSPVTTANEVPVATTRPVTTTTTPAKAKPSAGDYEKAIRDYYALLPGDPDTAWHLLTERAQRKSGSKEAYDRFWSRFSAIEVLSTKAQGDRVAAVLRFVERRAGEDDGDHGGGEDDSGEDDGGEDGAKSKTSTENYSFALVQHGDQLKIDNFAHTGHRR